MSTSHDYPAAHSMDTTWWGVDRDGRIARFDTGEAGAALSPPAEEIDAIALVSEAEGFSLSCDDLFPSADGKIFRRPSRWDDDSPTPLEVTAADDSYLPSFLLWLRDDAALKALRADPRCSEAVVLPSRGRTVVWLASDYRRDEESALLSAVLALQDRGHISRGWLYPYGDIEPERLGIFSYRLEYFDNWIAGPFTRRSVPESPLLVDQLPEEIGARLSLNELDADFSRDAMLQPYEHGEAYSWEEQWVSTTGRVLETEGDEEDEPSEEVAPSIPPPASTIGALVAAYLSGAPGSSDVLGDWLAEHGKPPIPEAQTAGERLDEVMFRWFSPDERAALEARFLAHALQSETPAEAVRAAIYAVLEAIAEGKSQEHLVDSEITRGAFVAWQPAFDGTERDPRESQLAWAAWALGNGFPLVAARTLRELSPEALSWQMTETIAEIERTA